MGLFQTKLNIFICGSVNTPENSHIIYKELFPAQKENQASTGTLKDTFCDYIKIDKKEIIENVQIEWSGYIIHPNLNEDLAYSLFYHIIDIYTNKKERNNVIICFSSDNDKYLLDAFKNLSEKESEQVLPIIIFVNKDNGDDFTKLKHINYIPRGDSISQTTNWIKSKLFSIDAYYNERGSIFDKYLYDRPEDYIEQGSVTCINLFLTGESRSGKSCFVNLSKGELCARESPDSTSVTTTCTEYTLPIRNTKDYENDILKGRIKLIDTPGFDTDKNIEIAKESIRNYIKKADDSKEMVHCVLYFLKEGNVFNNAKIDFLKFLYRKKIRIFFVINYANDDDTPGITKKSIKQMVKEYFGNEYNNVIFEGENDNIIQVNLKKVGKYGKPIFGVQNLYKKIYKYFNPEIYNEQLFQRLSDSSGNFAKQLQILKENTILFNKISCIEDIKAGARFKGNTIVNLAAGASGLAGFIPVPMGDMPVLIALQVGMVYSLARVYEFSHDEYDIKALLLSGGNKLTTEEIVNSIKSLDKHQIKKEGMKMGVKLGAGGGAFVLKEVIIEVTKEIGKRSAMATASEALKFVPILGTLVGGMISAALNSIMTSQTGKNTINLFEKKLMNDNGAGFLWKRVKIYMNIFDQIQFLSLKDDWQTIE